MCREPIEFDEDMMRKVKRLCSTRGYTPFMVLVSSLSILLYLWTGQRDIKLGTVLANRRRSETEGIIGHLANTVVLRLEVSSGTRLSNLLREARKVVLNAFAYQELPFEFLARVLERTHGSKRGSLFDVLLMYQHRSSRSRAAVGLTLASLQPKNDKRSLELSMTTCPLILRLFETPTMLTGTVNYKIDSFSSADVIRLPRGLSTTLRTVVSQSTEAVDDFTVGNLVGVV